MQRNYFKSRISKLRNRKYKQAAAKLLEDKVEYSDHMIYIDAFLLEIKERAEQKIQIRFPPVMQGCTCSYRANFCSRLLNNSSWISKNFGCVLAQHYSVLFDLADEEHESVFIRAGDGIQQIHTLRLKNEEI